MSGLRVQEKQCKTCVYLPNSPIRAEDLEERLIDPRMEGHFTGFRICHSSRTACCAGFWKKHKDHFDFGQLAQRLNWVEFVQDDVPTAISKDVARSWREKR